MTQITYANIYEQGLTDETSAAQFEQHLRALRAEGTRKLSHRIGGSRVTAGDVFVRHEPSDRSNVVAEAPAADADVIERAVADSRAAQPGWSARSAVERADIMSALVGLLRARRAELAALISLEVGKARADALVEVDESIVVVEITVRDYLEHDGFTVPLPKPAGAAVTELSYRPYGVFGAIAPFNFPLAIPLTGIVPALLTGNTVVFKPSALTPACGDAVYELLVRAGVPEGVVNLVQGDGPTGALLAESGVDGIVFTGSAEVGLGLVATLARPPYVRPVIAEMGGKNPAIITDAVADIEVAARAVARSAFGMTGQKCTACSRAIVQDGVYEDFIEALVAEARRYEFADPSVAGAFAGPLIDGRAVQRYQDAVAAARAEGRVLSGGGADLSRGNFVELTIVDGLEPGHRLTRQELFGPVLSVIRVPDLDAALDEANAVEFGLSAGIFTGAASERERFLAEIQAGIVFVNHQGGATTGVWPGNQTMVGWKASGTTGNGGFGPHYVQQFVREQSRTVYL